MGTTVIDSSDTPMTVEPIVALQREVRELAAERSAVILTHNSQRPEVQDVADFVGDSLALSREAAGSEAEVIAFCGVHFMAETASILSPDKTVLLPDLAAGCSLGTRSPQPSCGPGRRGTRARSW
jgi:quinolinate synthase